MKDKPHKSVVAVSYHGARTFFDSVGNALRAGGEGFLEEPTVARLEALFERGELELRDGEGSGETKSFTWSTSGAAPPSPAPSPAPSSSSSSTTELGLDSDPGSLTVGKLRAALEGVDDPEVLDALHDAERAGKNRTGAISAIEARLDEVDPPPVVDDDELQADEELEELDEELELADDEDELEEPDDELEEPF